MEVEDSRLGENGVLFMADCDVIEDPSVEQLAEVAVSTAQLAPAFARRPAPGRPAIVLHQRQRDASLGGQGPGRHRPRRQKAQEQKLDAEFDGELQVDAALVPEIAARKLPDSKLGGNANVLIFPDLNAGNIASKLARLVARANAYGHILLGLDRPAADLSAARLRTTS